MTQYYLDILQRIDALLQTKDFDTAKSIIEEELKAPYLPADFANELAVRRKKILSKTSRKTVSKYQIWSTFENTLQKGSDYEILVPWILAVEKQNLNEADLGYLNLIFSSKKVPSKIKFLLYLAIRKINFSLPISYLREKKMYELVPVKIDPFQKYDVYVLFKTIDTHFGKWPTALFSMKEIIIKIIADFFPSKNLFPWNDILVILWKNYCNAIELGLETEVSFINNLEKRSSSLENSKRKYRKYLESADWS